MRLADFIEANTEVILAEWESFASSLLPAAAGLDAVALRDHAQQILLAIAKDLRTPQTAAEPVDLATVCREEIDLLRAALPASKIEFATAGDTQGSWDASRIKQVVSNLVINAARYGDRSGTVRVSLRADHDRVDLSVENTGPGIAKDLMNVLFEPLRRHAGAEWQGERESLGLGLFIVRQIALAHGGGVAVQSAEGRTCFTVTLPKT